jgi:lipid-A-disaccharide synthase-like uncharacterized protein
MEKKNPELSQRFTGLFMGMRDARKLFRLFKTVNEYQKILQILSKGAEDEIDWGLSILTRILFGGYWVFDNLVVLCTVKFFKQDSKKYNKVAMWFWFLALLSGLIQSIRLVILLNHREIALAKKLHEAKDQDLENKKKVLRNIRALKKEQYLKIIGQLGDMIPAGQGSEIIPKLFKKNFNDGWIGLGGFVSAVVSSYQLYNA